MAENFSAVLRGNRLQGSGYEDDIDIQAAVRASILPRMQELRQYWKKRLQSVTKPVSFASFFTAHVPTEHSIVLKRTLSPVINKSIFQFIRDNGLTLHQFMTSLYQLLLHCLAGNEHVPVVTSADVRAHVPKLAEIATRCVNHFPVVAEVKAQESILQFIKRNQQDILNDLDHNAYPYQLIEAELNDDKLLQHAVVMDDKTKMSVLLDSQTSVRKIIHAHVNKRESVLYVAHDSKSEKIQLELGCTILSSEEGNLVLDQFICEIGFVLNHAHMSIRDVKKGLLNLKSVPAAELQKCTPKDQSPRKNGKIHQFGLTTGTEQGLTDIQLRNGTRDKFSESDTHQDVTVTDNRRSMGKRLHPPGKLKTTDPDWMQRPNAATLNTSERHGHANGLKTVSRDEVGVLCEGNFLEQTTNGWDHLVTLSLKTTEDINTRKYALQWNASGSKHGKFRYLSMTAVSEFHFKKLNGMVTLMFKTKNRWLVFKTHDTEQAFVWMAKLQNVAHISSGNTT